MIPFSPSFLLVFIPLMLVFGWPFAMLWIFWFFRLKLSPTARQNYQQKYKIKDQAFTQTPISAVKVIKEIGRRQPFLTIVFIIWVLSAALVIELNLTMKKIKAESQAEEALRTPTLTNTTTLAGITMPAGTKLELLHKGAVGEEWVKPDYFEYATFPKPILWQGVEIVAMKRFLDTKRDNDYSSCTAKHPEYDWEKCSDLSSYETTHILWGDVSATVAKPIKIGRFYCQGEIFWELAPDETGNVPDIDASLPVKDFVMSNECDTLAKGNIVSTENGFLSLELPENSDGYKATFTDGVDRKLWTVALYDGVWTGDLFTLYRTNNHSVSLNSDTFHLAEFGGEILSSTPDCPLTKNSYVEWHKDRADTLTVFTDTPIPHCGKFKLDYLNAHPNPEYAEFLKHTTQDR